MTFFESLTHDLGWTFALCFMVGWVVTAMLYVPLALAAAWRKSSPRKGAIFSILAIAALTGLAIALAFNYWWHAPLGPPLSEIMPNG